MNTKNETVIDCKSKQCSLKITKIEKDFRSINDGGTIRLLTDTNPKKLFYELLAKERGNFYWIPLEDGPKEWEVLIEKVSAF